MNLAGLTFGRLTVLSFSHSVHDLGAYWNCLCECGNQCVILASRLKSGNTKSCGCLKSDITRLRWIKPKGVASFNEFFWKYQDAAQRRGLDFKLSREEFRDITQKPCFYCGILPNSIFGRRNTNGGYIHNGIDRINNSKGYTFDNCVPCCKICNYMKHKLSQEEFLIHIKEIYEHQINKE